MNEKKDIWSEELEKNIDLKIRLLRFRNFVMVLLNGILLFILKNKNLVIKLCTYHGYSGEEEW